MTRSYPHLTNSNSFPYLDNVNVFQYRNDFDYSRWEINTVVKLCNVPWDSAYTDAVKFADDTARNAYFDNLQGDSITLTSLFWLLPDGTIKLPIPFNVAQGYNYIAVTFPIATGATPIAYEDGSANHRYFFFIDSVTQIAPNTTEFSLSLDAWTFGINSVDLVNVMLERGHYPVSQSPTPAQYLANPRENSRYLLDADIDYSGAPTVQRSKVAAHINDRNDMMLCVATTANIDVSFGSLGANTAITPAYNYQDNGQLPTNVKVFCTALSDYGMLFDFIANNAPWFIPTIQGIFILSADFMLLGDPFLLFGLQGSPACWKPVAHRFSESLSFAVSDFNIPSDYAGLTKLYTFPYSYIETTDATGAKSVIRVEQTGAAIDIGYMVSLAFPYIRVQSTLGGINGNAGGTFDIVNLNDQDFYYSGQWYDFRNVWDIPVYAVIQESKKNVDFSTYYERQAQYNSNAVSKTISDRSADQSATNTYTQTICNETNRQQNTATSVSILSDEITKIQVTGLRAREYTSITTNNNVNANAQTTAISNVSGAVQSTIGGAQSGAIGGPLGMVAGAVGGALSSIPNIIASNANLSVATNLAQSNLSAWITNSASQQQTMETYVSSVNTYTNSNEAVVVDNNNKAAEKIADDTKTVTKQNAADAKGAADLSVSYGYNSSVLNAPRQFGSTSNGQDAALLPMATFANIVRQNDSAITRAGDYMLRYGYAYSGYVDASELNVMPKFSYWKASDLYVSGDELTNDIRNVIKSILLNGVTVWRNASELGQVSIYANS